MKLHEIKGTVIDMNGFVRKLIHTVDVECRPYIDSFGGWNEWVNLNYEHSYRRNLFRGMTVPTHRPIGRKDVHKNREPKDTYHGVHVVVDDWFNREFGHRYRSNAMFATSNTAVAEEYGTGAYCVFPIGQYKMCFSESYEDLWDRLSRELSAFAHSKVAGQTKQIFNVDKIENEEQKQIIETTLKEGHYQERPAPDAINSKHEVMVACDRYAYIEWKQYVKYMLPMVMDMVEAGELK